MSSPSLTALIPGDAYASCTSLSPLSPYKDTSPSQPEDLRACQETLPAAYSYTESYNRLFELCTQTSPQVSKEDIVNCEPSPGCDLARLLHHYGDVVELFSNAERNVKLLQLLQKLHGILYNKCFHNTDYKTMLEIVSNDFMCAQRVLAAIPPEERGQCLSFLVDESICREAFINILEGADLLAGEGQKQVHFRDLRNLSLILSRSRIDMNHLYLNDLKKVPPDSRSMVIQLAGEVDEAQWYRSSRDEDVKGKNLITKFMGFSDEEIKFIVANLKSLSIDFEPKRFAIVHTKLLMKLPPSEIASVLHLAITVKEAAQRCEENISWQDVVENFVTLCTPRHAVLHPQPVAWIVRKVQANKLEDLPSFIANAMKLINSGEDSQARMRKLYPVDVTDVPSLDQMRS